MSDATPPTAAKKAPLGLTVSRVRWAHKASRAWLARRVRRGALDQRVSKDCGDSRVRKGRLALPANKVQMARRDFRG